MVGGIRGYEPGKHRLTSGILDGPIELAAVDHNAADHRTVARVELGQRRHHNVGPQFQGANQGGRSDRVIHNQWHIIAVRHLGNGRNVQHISLRISERFPIKRLRVRLHRGLPRCGIVGILNERGANTQPLQRASEQGERAAVESGAGHNMIPGLGQVQNRRGLSCLT